jgi:predicted nuclease with TOPRIM domain
MRELPDLLEDAERDREIAAIRERLAQLEFEKAELEGSLNKLLVWMAVRIRGKMAERK